MVARKTIFDKHISIIIPTFISFFFAERVEWLSYIAEQFFININYVVVPVFQTLESFHVRLKRCSNYFIIIIQTSKVILNGHYIFFILSETNTTNAMLL